MLYELTFSASIRAMTFFGKKPKLFHVAHIEQKEQLKMASFIK
jgi:hypothetical protein